MRGEQSTELDMLNTGYNLSTGVWHKVVITNEFEKNGQVTVYVDGNQKGQNNFGKPSTRELFFKENSCMCRKFHFKLLLRLILLTI